MATAILMGATSGAVHAVTGPDHLLSLGAQALHGVRRAFRVGLSWGVGHGVGTLILAVPLVVVSRNFGVELLAAYSERIAGVVLMATAAWTLVSAKSSQVDAAVGNRAPALVGLIHGITGAGALVLMLPAIVNTNAAFAVVFLIAFAVGSAVSMAVLTATLGLFGQRLHGLAARKSQQLVAFGALVLGAVWTFGS